MSWHGVGHSESERVRDEARNNPEAREAWQKENKGERAEARPEEICSKACLCVSIKPFAKM